VRKNRFLYVLSLAVFWFVVIELGEPNGSALLYALILLPAVSLVSLWISPRLIHIDEAVERTDVSKNEPLRYSVCVIIKGFFPYPAITFQFYGGDFVRYEKVPAEPDEPEEYLLSFPYRGKYMVGIEKFYVTDFMGLFRFGFSKKTPVTVTVFPEKIENFTPELKSELLSKTASAFDMLNDNQTDVSDIRKYAPSDDYKKIHWKLTAKRNEFIVKDYLSSVLNRTYVFLDTKAVPLSGENRLKFEDRLVSYALSAVNYCVISHLPASLCLGPLDSDRTDVLNRGDFDLVSCKLAEAAFGGSGCLEIFDDFYQKEDFYNLVIFIFDICGDLFNSISNLSQMGHNVALYYAYGYDLSLDDAVLNYLSVLTGQGVAVKMISME